MSMHHCPVSLHLWLASGMVPNACRGVYATDAHTHADYV